MHLIGITERRNRGNGEKAVHNELLGGNFLELMKA